MNTNRDSFDHRIDDDLFEEIISYLSIEDKFRYESVSKRFQSFVFNKQKALIIGWKDSADYIKGYQLVTDSKINVNNLRSLLKKMQFITTIKIDIHIEEKNSSEVLDTITDNCHHLTAIQMNLDDVKSHSLRKFFGKFAQQLRHISFNFGVNEEVLKTMFEFSPNLTSLSDIRGNIWPQMLTIARIERLDIFRHKLSSIQFNLKYLNVFVEIENQSNPMALVDISQLQSLKQLKINVIRECDPNAWLQLIQSIASNCLQLEYFSFQFRIKDYFKINECLESIGQLSALKKLVLNNYWDDSKPKPLDLKPLKNCKNLLVLNIRTNYINNNTFDGIHLIVPNLRELLFETKQKITNKAFKSMANLKRLTHLSIVYSEVMVSIEGIETLLNGCQRLKYLRINSLGDRQNYQWFTQLKAQHKHIEFIIWKLVVETDGSKHPIAI